MKEVASGSAAASSWTLSASGPEGSLPGPAGASGSAEATLVQISPDQPYALSESGGPATYVQIGQWACEDDVTGDPVEVSEASEVEVGEEQLVTCTVVNSTAQITLLKEVADGPAAAADWILRATPEALDGLDEETVEGAQYDPDGNPESSFEVRPGHAYTLEEELTNSDVPSTYRQVGLEILNEDGSWSEVASEQITAPEAGSEAVYRFVNRMSSSIVLPLTGGTGAYLYYFVGGGLLLAVLVFGGIARLRRSRSAHGSNAESRAQEAQEE
ncbi:hypothetical protein D3C74_276630 [compost metagenome]